MIDVIRPILSIYLASVNNQLIKQRFDQVVGFSVILGFFPHFVLGTDKYLYEYEGQKMSREDCIRERTIKELDETFDQSHGRLGNFGEPGHHREHILPDSGLLPESVSKGKKIHTVFKDGDQAQAIFKWSMRNNPNLATDIFHAPRLIPLDQKDIAKHGTDRYIPQYKYNRLSFTQDISEYDGSKKCYIYDKNGNSKTGNATHVTFVFEKVRTGKTYEIHLQTDFPLIRNRDDFKATEGFENPREAARREYINHAYNHGEEEVNRENNPQGGEENASAQTIETN